MTTESLPQNPSERELERRLEICKQSIHELVKRGEYTNATKVEITKYDVDLGSLQLTAYDAFSYWSEPGNGPSYGLGVDYKNTEGRHVSETLIFAGYDETPQYDQGGSLADRQAPTIETLEMFEQLLRYTLAHAKTVSRPAETWRGEPWKTTKTL